MPCCPPCRAFIARRSARYCVQKSQAATGSRIVFKDGLLKSQRILVTGGGTGLGKVMAERFLELGAEIFICGRRKSVCDATAAELVDKHGGQVTSYGVDIRNAAAVDEMIEDIFRGGPLTG